MSLVLVGCAHAAPVESPAAAAPAAQPAIAVGPEWSMVKPLLGSWEGSDPARHETGRFSLAPELGGKVLIRHNTDDSPTGHHEDLMIIYSSPAGLRATYFDNEGHVIQYAINASGSTITLLSDEVAGAPRFKLTYDTHEPNALAIDFAIAPPGGASFQRYTSGVVHRVN